MNEDKQQIEEYLREIASISTLTDEDTRQLIESREAALQRVTQAHLHLVVPIVEDVVEQNKKKNLPYNAGMYNLVLKGNIALIRAIETFYTFHTTTQEPFSSYATRAIRAAIAQDLQDN